MKNNAHNLSALATLKSLEIEQSASFPIEKMFAIRTATSNVNAIRNQKSLTTKTDREKGTITVTRIA